MSIDRFGQLTERYSYPDGCGICLPCEECGDGRAGTSPFEDAELQFRNFNQAAADEIRAENRKRLSGL